jgi:hypothetical protein
MPKLFKKNMNLTTKVKAMAVSKTTSKTKKAALSDTSYLPPPQSMTVKEWKLTTKARRE